MVLRSDTPVFKALDDQGAGAVSVGTIRGQLRRAGLLGDDPRLANVLEKLTSITPDGKDAIDEAAFLEVARSGSSLIERATRQELVIPDFEEFSNQVRDIFDRVKENSAGSVATYIPQLARVDPDQFGLAICTIDGQRLHLGDSDKAFSFQSSCKPILYSAVLDLCGEDYVHRHVGREPSGLSFNELTLNKQGLPHNPMINAGAIMCASLWHPERSMSDRYDELTKLVSVLSGDYDPGFDNATFHSEKDTADRNFALAHYMREVDAFPAGTDILRTLELYFAACAMEISPQRLATMAATFANGGVCPPTGRRVLADSTVKNCLSMMYSCGMYDYSGEFAFRVGMPAKSAVSGAIFAIVPNVMGIAIWSPRLDQYGNSVRGVEFLTRLVETFNFHNYDSLLDTRKADPRGRRQASEVNATFRAIHAASRNDVDELKVLVAYGHSLNDADYDGRTPLHLAAVEGHGDAVRYLLAQGVDVNPLDRWGNTPLQEAQSNDRTAVVELLRPEEPEAIPRRKRLPCAANFPCD